MNKLLQFVVIIFACYLTIVMLFYLFQRKLLYMPTSLKTLSALFEKDQVKTIQLTTEDGLILEALYQPAVVNRPTLLVFSGNASYLGQLTTTQASLLGRGYGLLQVTYRGYSGNPGKPTETGLYQDARAAMHYLLNNNITPEHIIIFGESLGAAVAVQLATEMPARALILQAPFDNLTNIARYHYPYLPSQWLLCDKFDSHLKIKHVNAPVLIVHGEQDAVVPIRYGRALFAAAVEPKEMLTFDHVGHNDIQDYSNEFEAFLKRNSRPNLDAD